MSTLLHLSTLIELATAFWASFTGLFEATILLAALNYLAILIRKIYQFTCFVYDAGRSVGHVYYTMIKPQLDRIDWVHVRKTALADSVRTISATIAAYQVAAHLTRSTITAVKAAHKEWVGTVDYAPIAQTSPINVCLPIVKASDLPTFTPSYA